MSNQPHHVVIIGGGFGGINAAKQLGNQPLKVTLIDKRNFHLFQPLLYQVATGGISPGDIAHPLRMIFRDYDNILVLKAEVTDIDPEQRQVILKDGTVHFDSLIVATGSTHHYFGNDQWEQHAPGLKTIEDATEMRRRILLAFEAAEREPDPVKRQAWLTFVVVGGGPTGVELAGTLAELTYRTLRNDFRNIDPTEANVFLLEAMDRVLPPYSPNLSHKAQKSLEKLGVKVKTKCMVTNVEEDMITITPDGQDEPEQIQTQTILWGAGMKASPMSNILAERTDAPTDRSGRLIVEPDLSLPNQPHIFAIGDMANYSHQGEDPLPGLAAVAMQQGNYVAKLILAQTQSRALPTFHYQDKGQMSIIGRNSAVAAVGSWEFSGFVAWLAWIFVHIYYLIGFDNKIVVLLQWAWNYFTYGRGACLITNETSFELVQPPPENQLQSSS